MGRLGEAVARQGWTLRSGMSPGADRAFYRGALSGGGCIELFLPHPGFGRSARRSREEKGRVRELARPTAAAYLLARRFEPDWDVLADQCRALLARDAHQVLGRLLCEPAAVVICWTPEGDIDGRAPRAGGTGQALRIAAASGIPVLNLCRPEHVQRARRLAGLR